MTFNDLPSNWTELPLSTPHLAGDVVDLVLNESLRAQNTLMLLPCDEHDLGYPTPVAIGETDWFVDHDERRQMLQSLAELELPAAVLAVSAVRRIPAPVVNSWYVDAQDAFTASGTRLIGFFCAWANHVNEVFPPRR